MTPHFTNIDETEILKFEALASIWWDREGRFKALHDINDLRLNYIDVRARLAGKRVLDVGCGGGILTEAMAARGAEATGIDMGEAPLKVAKRHLMESGLHVEYRLANAEGFAADHPERFQVVTCMELLEHVPRPSSVVHACGAMVKPKGDVFFATINRNPKAFLFAILGGEYLLGLVPKGTHSYHRFIKPAELRGWGREAGLRILNLTGLHYNPFLRRYSLGGNVHVNYMMHFRRC